MTKIPSLIAVSLAALLAACAPAQRTDGWRYRLREESVAQGVPIPPGITVADAPTTPTQVKIDPQSSLSFKRVPEEFKKLYDKEPLPINLYKVVAETVANDRTIQIDHYDVRIAQEVIAINKGIYDAISSASIQASRDKVQSASVIGPSGTRRLELGQAGLSQLLPTGAFLDLDYQYSRTRQQDPFANLTALVPSPTAFPATLNPEISHAVALTLTQPLLQGFGPKITNVNIKIARLDAEAAEGQFEARLQDQIKGSLDLYWELLFQVERYDIQLLSFMAASELVRISEARQKVGVGAHADVLQARARAEARRQRIIEARQLVRDAEDALKATIFIRDDAPDWSLQLLPTEPLAWKDLQLDEQALVEDAIKRRPEVASLERLLDRRDLEIFKAKDKTKARLDLFATAGVSGLDDTNREAIDTLGSGDYDRWAVGLSFSRPIRNIAARHGLEAARLGQEKTWLEYKRLLDQVALQTRVAARAVRTTREQIDIALIRVKSEEANLHDEKRRLEVGISTSFEVLAFQEFLANAQESYIRAVVDYNKALTALSRATGSLLETYGIEIEPRP